MATLRSKNADDTDDCGLVEFSDRRRFFATAFAVGTIGLNPHDALGVDFMGKFSSAGNGNGMPSNGGVSKKVGGLANKIRGICLHMVRRQRECYHRLRKNGRRLMSPLEFFSIRMSCKEI